MGPDVLIQFRLQLEVLATNGAGIPICLWPGLVIAQWARQVNSLDLGCQGE